MKKFKDGDIFVNSVKTYPKVKLFGYDGKIYINNTSETSVKLNDFLPEPPPPPPPPPPTEATTLFLTSGTTYLASGAGLLEPEYDIYPLDFTSAPSTCYVGIDWDPALHSGTQVIFRRDDTNVSVTATLFESGVPGYYNLPVGGSLTFASDGITWVLQ